MDVTLVMFKADGTRKDFPIKKDRVVLGRTNSCDLRIPLSSVSRQHCEVTVDGDTVSVRDLGSSNGTYRNSTRITEAQLEPGDELVIGPVVFTVVVNGSPAKIEPVRTLVGIGGSEKPEPRPATPQEPTSLSVEDEEDELPDIEPEAHTPTVDLDDPIAALQAMSSAEDEDDELPLLADDEEDEKQA